MDDIEAINRVLNCEAVDIDWVVIPIALTSSTTWSIWRKVHEKHKPVYTLEDLFLQIKYLREIVELLAGKKFSDRESAALVSRIVTLKNQQEQNEQAIAAMERLQELVESGKYVIIDALDGYIRIICDDSLTLPNAAIVSARRDECYASFCEKDVQSGILNIKIEEGESK